MGFRVTNRLSNLLLVKSHRKVMMGPCGRYRILPSSRVHQRTVVNEMHEIRNRKPKTLSPTKTPNPKPKASNLEPKASTSNIADPGLVRSGRRQEQPRQ